MSLMPTHLYLPLDFTCCWPFYQATSSRKIYPCRREIFGPIYLLSEKKGTQDILVSGKLSERSASRLATISPLARKLFSHYDHLCVQNPEHKRVSPLLLTHPAPVTGNLKFDLRLRKSNLCPANFLTMSCTHAPEEKRLLDLMISG